MPYNISASCSIGPILSRRIQPQRAVKQARDYRKLGYTNIKITDVDTGETYDAAALAAIVQAQLAERQAQPNK
jgi:hypothetical protein